MPLLSISNLRVKKADVFLTNYRRDVVQRLGMDYPTLRLRGYNPRLIYAHASGYGPLGSDAHNPGQDHPGQARSGVMLWGRMTPRMSLTALRVSATR